MPQGPQEKSDHPQLCFPSPVQRAYQGDETQDGKTTIESGENSPEIVFKASNIKLPGVNPERGIPTGLQESGIQEVVIDGTLGISPVGLQNKN